MPAPRRRPFNLTPFSRPRGPPGRRSRSGRCVGTAQLPFPPVKETEKVTGSVVARNQLSKGGLHGKPFSVANICPLVSRLWLLCKFELTTCVARSLGRETLSPQCFRDRDDGGA